MTASATGRWAILRFRPYLLYFFGHTISMLGTGMQFIASSWLAMQLTGEAYSVAFVLVASSLPGIVLSPIIGIYVDRFDRKWVAVLMDILRAVVLLAVPVLWWRGTLEAWHLYVMTFLVALGDEIYFPSAMSLIREVLPKEMLLYANSTNTIAMQIGALAGAGLGGIIVAVYTPVVAMIVNAGSFLVSGLCIALMRKGVVRPNVSASPGGFGQFMQEMREGIQYIQAHPHITVQYLMMLFIRMTLYTINVLLAPFAKDVLSVGAQGFGYIDAAFAAGAVFGNVLLPSVVKARGPNWTMTAGMWGTALFLLLFGFSINLSMALVTYFLFGAAFQVGVLYLTKAQEGTDIRYQGRVHATFNTFFSMISLVVYLGMGFLSHVVSFRLIYTFQACLVAVAALTAYMLIYRKEKELVRHVV